jgi:hypothetical protein
VMLACADSRLTVHSHERGGLCGQVAVLPGTLFHAPGMFRICFAAPPPILKEACARIAALCQRLAIPQPGTPSA